MDSLTFEWFSEGSWQHASAEHGPIWRGTATETREIGVSVILHQHSNQRRVLTGRAVVRSRPWALGILNAKLEYSLLPGDPDYWGLYERPTLAGNMAENIGTGLWEGTFYIHASPRWIGNPKMYVHTDFRPSGNPYLVADTTCERAAGLIGQSVNVRSLNWTCDRDVALGNFHDLMVAHENMHQRSLNECITTVNRRYGRLAAIEGIVSNRRGDAKRGG